MKHIGFLILIFLSSYAIGQENDLKINETRLHAFEFRTGYAQQKEGNLHNKVFNGIKYGFHYSGTQQRENLSYLKIALENAHLKTNIEDGFSSALANISLDYNYLFTVSDLHKWEIHSGFGTRLNYNIGYYWIWDESHLYRANFLSFNLSQRLVYKTNRDNRLIWDFSVPVFLFLSRPEIERNFKMDDFSFSGILSSLHYKPEAKFLTSSIFLSMSLEYQYKRKNRLQPFLSYSFNYYNLKTTYSNSAQSVQHAIGLKWPL